MELELIRIEATMGGFYVDNNRFHIIYYS